MHIPKYLSTLLSTYKSTFYEKRAPKISRLPI